MGADADIDTRLAADLLADYFDLSADRISVITAVIEDGLNVGLLFTGTTNDLNRIMGDITTEPVLTIQGIDGALKNDASFANTEVAAGEFTEYFDCVSMYFYFEVNKNVSFARNVPVLVAT